MRVVATIAVGFLCLVPTVSANTTPARVLDQIVAGLPHHLRGLQHPALADSTDMRQYAVANVTIGGNEKSFGHWAASLHSDTTAAAMLATYREANQSQVRLDTGTKSALKVLALGEFVSGPVTYDWDRLNRRYPTIRAVLHVSQPAVVGDFAVVRFEMIGEGGTLWHSLVEFQRNGTGEWQYARAVAGLFPE